MDTALQPGPAHLESNKNRLLLLGRVQMSHITRTGCLQSTSLCLSWHASSMSAARLNCMQWCASHLQTLTFEATAHSAIHGPFLYVLYVFLKPHAHRSLTNHFRHCLEPAHAHTSPQTDARQTRPCQGLLHMCLPWSELSIHSQLSGCLCTPCDIQPALRPTL